ARRLAASLTRLARVGNDPLLRPVVVLGSDGCSTIAGECREGQLRLRLHWRGVDVPMGLSQALATDLGRLLDRIARQADG
ncbi:MAG: hypothetical protein R3310_16835, partial [Candidatus Competibacteraceae bacterium]|nr:hypothetical protein [Candidatus Competibacteraceae bacterium]